MERSRARWIRSCWGALVHLWVLGTIKLVVWLNVSQTTRRFLGDSYWRGDLMIRGVDDTSKVQRVGAEIYFPCDVRDVHGRLIDLNLLQTLLVRVKEAFHPEQVWLFGSRARGDAQPGSDWDLLVVVPDNTREDDLDPAVCWRIQKGSGVYADILPYRASEFRDGLGTVNSVLYDVQREGVLIYAR